MKILHVLDIPWWSGLSAYAFDCVEAHKSLGHETLLACEKDTLPYRKAVEKGWEVAEIFGRSNVGGFLNFFVIGSLLLRERPECAVSHTGSTHWIFWLWSHVIPVRVIRTRATSQKIRRSAVNRVIYARADAVIAASDHLKRECESLLNGGNHGIRVLYPPVVLPRSSAPLPSGGIFGILARLDPVKGHAHLLQAFRKVQDAYPEAQLRLAGGEENIRWGDLLKEIQRLRLTGVTYHGFLPREKIPEFLRGCAAGLIPSIGSEEVSRALLEWMSEGRPVIASRVGCMPEILQEGQGGYVIDPFDEGQWAKKMEQLIAQPEEAAKMGESNRRRCADFYSPEKFASGWEAVLDPK